MTSINSEKTLKQAKKKKKDTEELETNQKQTHMKKLSSAVE